MIRAIHHLAIATHDLERLLAFYQLQIGFQMQHRGSWAPDNAAIDAMVGLKGSSADYAVLALGDVRLELFRYHSPAARRTDMDRPVCDGGLTHLCLQVDDLEADHRRLADAGMRFHAPPSPLKEGQLHRAVYGRDPDGNVIELIEILAQDHPFGARAERAETIQ